jgi:hypothetical protein
MPGFNDEDEFLGSNEHWAPVCSGQGCSTAAAFVFFESLNAIPHQCVS